MDPLPHLSPEELQEDKSPLVLGVISMCLFISTGILILRLWTRFHIVKRIGIDDWAAAFSLVSSNQRLQAVAKPLWCVDGKADCGRYRY